ncbi:hypothetical protein N752_15880 [Desulforamulus aquiferis]|nr:EAL domain-containing protein [Desulforamulus aquiferis]RYD04322.1 hypothetical protein N752_15880 [Desulforamulus aquiferis]
MINYFRDSKRALVLVVDDSKFMRFKLREFLENEGYLVEEAENGEKALAAYNLHKPDMVLMDCVMPVMNGFTACAHIRQIPGGERVPIIIITSLYDDKDVEQAYKAGATDFITKPVNWAVLRNRVGRLIKASVTERTLGLSEAFAQTIIENALDGIITINSGGYILTFNKAAESIFGHKAIEVLGENANILVDNLNCTEKQCYLDIASLRLEELAGETRAMVAHRKEGGSFPVEITASRFRAMGEILYTLIIRDISERKRKEERFRESEERYRTLTENMYDLISEIDINGFYLYASPNFEDVLGYSPLELKGKQIAELTYFEDVDDVMKELHNIYEHKNTGHLIARFVHKDGEIKRFESTGKTYKAASGDSRIVFVSRDITERQRYEDTIRYQAFHDALTGLPNRMLFTDRLNLELAHTKRNKQVLAVLFLDLDRFKLINDTLGHGVGDQILKEVSIRIAASVREDDTVARLGGDEFTILLPEVKLAENAAKVAGKILETINKPFEIYGHKLYLSTSIGIVIYPDDGEDCETLLKNADTAMYLAKEKGRNNYQLYTPTMNEKAFERLEMESSLRRALEQQEFVLFYQPKISIENGQIIGMEALIRWQHPQRGLIPPIEFIPIAEDTGLIVPIGEWVLRTACIQNKEWQKAGYTPIRVAVNISSRQFQLQNLADTISRILAETGLEPNWLELEITESVAMENGDYTIQMLEKLTKMGIQLSIDDFGTGYSSLSYLNRFPINKLKIDKSFITNLSRGNEDAAIASTVIVLGRSLRIGVVAEGVETPEQYNFLKECNCDEMQGYLFSKPVPAKEFERMLKERIYYNP